MRDYPKCILVLPVETEIIHPLHFPSRIIDLFIMDNQQPFSSREGFCFILSSTSTMRINSCALTRNQLHLHFLGLMHICCMLDLIVAHSIR